MIAFLRYLRGFVQVKIWGFSPERFFNLCSNKHILLWDIKKDETYYYLSMSLKDFWKLRPIVRKTKTRVVLLKRCGLPFLVPNLLARKMFILGLLGAFSFWIWTSFFIWEISVIGNETITAEVFQDFLIAEEIYVGMSKGKVDIPFLEKEIRRQFDTVTWTSAKLNGTRLEIVIKENSSLHQKEPEPDYPYGSDLIAGVEGKIVSMIVRKGVPQVTIGEEITKDTVLLRGQVPVLQEDGTVKKYLYVRSDGDIFVEHTLPIQIKLPFTHLKKQYTGRTKTTRFFAFSEKELELSLSKVTYPNYDVVSEMNRFSLLENWDTPVTFGTYWYREYLLVETKYTIEEAKAHLSEKYSEILATLEEKGVQIIGKDVKIETDRNAWLLTGNLVVIEKAGREEPSAYE